MSAPSAPDVFGGTLRATRTPFLPEMTEEERAASAAPTARRARTAAGAGASVWMDRRRR